MDPEDFICEGDQDVTEEYLESVQLEGEPWVRQIIFPKRDRNLAILIGEDSYKPVPRFRVFDTVSTRPSRPLELLPPDGEQLELQFYAQAPG